MLGSAFLWFSNAAIKMLYHHYKMTTVTFSRGSENLEQLLLFISEN